MFLSNQWFKERNQKGDQMDQKEIKNYLTSENINAIYQNLWDAGQVVLVL